MQSHLTRRQALQLLAIPATGATALGSLAQGGAYPSKPIKIIVPWTAGGGGDALFHRRGTAGQQHGADHQGKAGGKLHGE